MTGTPVEVWENLTSTTIEKKALLTDSGGAGKWRGGLGYFLEFEWLRGEGMATVRRDRHKFAPWGLAGGHDGPLCETRLARAGEDSNPLPSKCALDLHPGDRVQLWTTGSGGHGSPLDRNANLVLEDVLDGRVSESAARESYGLIVTDGAIDKRRTEALGRRRAMNE